MTDFRIVMESFGALQKPDVQLSFTSAQIGSELRVITLRIIDQESGMNLKELGK